jgi:hypothetical protein
VHRSFSIKKITEQIVSLFAVDRRIIFSVVIFCVGYKYFLKFIHTVLNNLPFRRKKDYGESIFGYMEPAVRNVALFFPTLYVVDVIAILLDAFGIKGHIKGGIPMLFCQLAYQYMIGSFLVHFKDWVFQQHIRKRNKTLMTDSLRAATVDELTSLVLFYTSILYLHS